MDKELKKRRKFLKEHYEDRRREIKQAKQENAAKLDSPISNEHIREKLAKAIELEKYKDELRRAAIESLESARDIYLEAVENALKMRGYNLGNAHTVKRRAFAKNNQFIEFFFSTNGGKEDLMFIGALTIGKPVRGVKTFDVSIKTLDDPNPHSVFIVPE